MSRVLDRFRIDDGRHLPTLMIASRRRAAE